MFSLIITHLLDIGQVHTSILNSSLFITQSNMMMSTNNFTNYCDALYLLNKYCNVYQ